MHLSAEWLTSHESVLENGTNKKYVERWFSPLFTGESIYANQIADGTATISPLELRTRLLFRRALIVPDADKRLKTAQNHFKDDHDKKIRNTPQTFYMGQYMYIDRTPMITCTAERLASNSYSKVLSANNGPFWTVQFSPSTVIMDGKGLSNIGSVDQ